MSRKIPISVNEEDYNKVLELAGLLGLDPKVYGWFPKTVKFSIDFALTTLKTNERFIPDLKGDNLDLLLSSVKRIRAKKEIKDKVAKLQKQAEKV